ncbi:MAG: hypothetical protein HKM95_03035, partial [Inquilinus sp.]|nr:hypothetical protein [Inquilinus sp.]
DRDHRIVAINKRFKALWALNDKDAATGADHRRTAERLRRLQRPSPVPRADEATGTSLVELNDGRIFERQVVDYRLDGAAIGQVQTIRDVTGRIAADRELLRAKEMAEAGNRAKSEFLAHISHELRTPLNAIIGFSEIYLRQLFGDMGNPRYLDYAKDIHESATLLLSLINDILDLSKIEAGRAELFDEAVTLRKTARQCFRLVRSRAAEAELALEFTVPAELPVLRADERAIKQMLVNLLTNAIKFTPAGGRVRLEAAVDGDGALIVEIVDTGIGMSAEQIARALEPFGRVDSAFHRSREGTGLGLPLVKSLIEAQGGRLEIDSEPDKGTTTRLIFPPERVGGEAPGTDSE